jgi:hypothetical protein
MLEYGLVKDEPADRIPALVRVGLVDVAGGGGSVVDAHSGHGRARRATVRHNITCDPHGRDYSKTLLLFIITQKARDKESK